MCRRLRYADDGLNMIRVKESTTRQRLRYADGDAFPVSL